jgi:hypothetical protein
MLIKGEWNQRTKSIVVNQDTQDEALMVVNPSQAMLYPADIGLFLDPSLQDILAKQLNKETISNFETFINSFMSRLKELFSKPLELSAASLIGN